MSLQTGTRLGPYEVLSVLGAGGMGEVYKARDTRLDRTVAVKVLPAHLADDSQFRDRFEREAKAIAALTHPHICTLYDVGRQDATEYLVMEYLEGETLESRLKKGALPVDQALKTAIEIASALDKAHRSGIVHRDLKPGNIMLTKTGAKLLDFGLAKASPAEAGLYVPAGHSPADDRSIRLQPDGLTTAPTTPPNLTAQGAILGTFQYMAPEQLEGHEADARTDIFAFGAVLYEMITGRKAFEGKSQASLIGAILKDEPPPISSVQPVSPPALDFLVRKCLAKDQEDRWQTARDVRSQLEWIAQGGGSQRAATPMAAQTGSPRRQRLAWTMVAILSALLVASVGVARYFVRPVEQRDVRFDIAVPQMPNAYDLAASPDGRLVVFAAQATGSSAAVLWVRPMSSPVAQPLEGTEGASRPFWSADSREIGFVARQKVQRVSVRGGRPETLCDCVGFSAGAWSREGVILFSTGDTLYRVAAAGGQPVPVTTLDAAARQTAHLWPSFLPDGRHFVYLAWSADPSYRALYVGTLDSPERVRLVAAESMAVYAPPGFLLFQRAGVLLAQRFDAQRLQVGGDPVRIADDIAFNGGNGRAALAVSEAGSVVYRRGGGVDRPSRMTWFDRTGKMLGTAGEPGSYGQIVLSPDEKKVATARYDAEARNTDIWVLELATDVLTRVTEDPAADQDPIWSPDGQTVMFDSNRKGRGLEIYQRSLGGAEDTLVFGSTDQGTLLDDWSRDGKFILFHGNQRIFALPLAGDRKTMPLIQTRFNRDEAHFSPDGRSVTYNSNESGASEVWVASFPTFENRRQVSSRGGGVSRWRADGRELFYMSTDGKLMSVPVTPGPVPIFGTPTVLFQSPIRTPALNIDQYAVTGDGQRFLILNPVADAAPAPITVVLDWTRLLPK